MTLIVYVLDNFTFNFYEVESSPLASSLHDRVINYSDMTQEQVDYMEWLGNQPQLESPLLGKWDRVVVTGRA